MAVSIPTPVASFLSGAATATSGPQTLSAAVAAGDVLVVAVTGSQGTPTFTVADSKSHTWSTAGVTRVTTGAQNSSQVFWTVVTTPMTTSDTITVTRSNSEALAFHAYKLTGVNGSAPVSSSPISNGTTSPANLPSALNVAEGDLALFAMTTNSTRTVDSIGGGFTGLHDGILIGAASRRTAAAYRQISGVTSVSPTMALSGHDSWSATGVVFTAAPAAPASNRHLLTASGWVPIVRHIVT